MTAARSVTAAASLVFALLGSCARSRGALELRDGDLIFQTSRSSQSLAMSHNLEQRSSLPRAWRSYSGSGVVVRVPPQFDDVTLRRVVTLRGGG
jgi:hypothetical protein